MIKNIGYACVNLTLAEQGITTGRSVRKATWQSKGLDVISDKAVQNVRDLLTIVKWNTENGFHFYRVGSELLPWQDFYDLDQLKDSEEIRDLLGQIGDWVTEHQQRLTFHPGPFNVLASPNQDVVERTIRELDNHSMLFNLMGLEPSHYNKINIHIGGAYGDKQAALKRWIQNWKRLAPHTQARLVIENDDKLSMFTVEDLYGVHKEIGIPVTFDYYHHSLNPGNQTQQEALAMATSTWPTGITPATHYSECRRDEQQLLIENICKKHRLKWEDIPNGAFRGMWDEFQKIKITAHSDYIQDNIRTFGHDIDVMVEAKAKELAVTEWKQKQDKKLLVA